MGINQTIKDNALSLKPFGLGLLWTIDSEFLHKLPWIVHELSLNYQFLSWAALRADALLISQSCEQSSSQSRLTPEIKNSSLARLCDRCNFARENMESVESVESVESLGSPGSLGSPDSVLSNNKNNWITNKTTVALTLLAIILFCILCFMVILFNNVRVRAKVVDGVVARQH